MKTTAISIDQYVYDLPDERIAKYPLPERDLSKLLIYRKGEISERTFMDLAEVLPVDSLLIRNDTKVIRARLLFTKTTGGQVEIFCLEPHDPSGYDTNLLTHKSCVWLCLVGNARRWRNGILKRQIPKPDGGQIYLRAERLAANLPEGALVHFSWDDPQVSFGEILELCGVLPIPPYLHRETEDADADTYQTVYAEHLGSVAAPTAGLHFSSRIFERIDSHGIPVHDLTLHVGAGTFRPVKTATIGEHHMHRELAVVSLKTIEAIRDTQHCIIAVGTTSVRTLESLYYIGLQIMANDEVTNHEWTVEQWEPYTQRTQYPSRSEALSAVAHYMQTTGLVELAFHTGILIAPGYQYRVVKGIITNFHQPQSTLLLLIAAFVGDDWRMIYDYALTHDFRFLSYGDSSLLLP